MPRDLNETQVGQKEIQLSRRAMLEQRQSGCADAVATFSHPEVLQRPYMRESVRTFDFTKAESEPS
jgi:hypothetical protein